MISAIERDAQNTITIEMTLMFPIIKLTIKTRKNEEKIRREKTEINDPTSAPIVDEIYWCLRDCLLLKHFVNVALGSDGQVIHAVLNNAFFLKVAYELVSVRLENI